MFYSMEIPQSVAIMITEPPYFLGHGAVVALGHDIGHCGYYKAYGNLGRVKGKSGQAFLSHLPSQAYHEQFRVPQFLCIHSFS